MNVRQAVTADAGEIAAFLQELTAHGKRTRPDSLEFVRDYYIDNVDTIRCSVAEDESGALVGIQILLTNTDPAAGETGDDWASVGTHVKPSAAGQGVGRALFAATQEAAKAFGIAHIEAMIGADNAEGLGYYGAMGFVTEREIDTRVRKRFDLV